MHLMSISSDFLFNRALFILLQSENLRAMQFLLRVLFSQSHSVVLVFSQGDHLSVLYACLCKPHLRLLNTLNKAHEHGH